MKLYNILYEAAEFSEANNPARFTSPEYALITSGKKSSANLILINVEKYKNREEVGGDIKFMPLENWVVGSIGPESSPNGECSGAKQVSYIVASPKYKKAGYALYCFLSKVLSKPLTSDRFTSTSDPAKVTWSKYIENSSDWQKVPLDNYSTEVLSPYGEKEEKQYFDVIGNYPQRKLSPRKGPRTPEPSDDCALPNTSTIKGIDRDLGTADAYLYNGDLDPQPLIDNGISLLQDINEKTDISIAELTKEIQIMSNRLFSKYYAL